MKWIIVCIVGVIAAAFIVSVVVRHPAVRPNVVLVSIDTLRADHLHSYGYGKVTSPFIDSLTEKGVAFRDTISQANWTLPSHASLFTSLYPAVHGAQSVTDALSPSLVTMAEILRRNGYRTAAFVDGGVMASEFGFDQGFDLYDDSFRGEAKDRAVLEWLAENGDEPFFLFYHTYEVHFPYRHHPFPREYNADRGLRDRALKIRGGGPPLTDEEYERLLMAFLTNQRFYELMGLRNMKRIKDEIYRFARRRWPKMPSCKEHLNYLIEAYDSGITYFDNELKDLWEQMEEMGLADKTLLIVTSDHGDCFLEHNMVGHPEMLYDEMVRVPLVMVYPPFERYRGMRDEQVMSIDILPTLLDILAVDRPAHLQGRSFLPLVTGEGKGDGWDESAYSDCLQAQSIRTDGWKLIHAEEPGRTGEDAFHTEHELYELGRDPREKRNRMGEEKTEYGKLYPELNRWKERNAELRGELGYEKTADRVTLDDETADRLKALGYMQ
jgi:arylsulfatase A-like enzyme